MRPVPPAPVARKESDGRLPAVQRFGYGIGEAALNLLVAGISNYLLFFYTDVFGLTAGAAGLLMLIGRLWDASNDPLMGVLADRTESRWGKFRPYLLFGAAPVAALTALTFTTPAWGATGKLVWAYTTFLLWSMAFTAVAVPYNALLVNLTSDPQERTSLSAIKTIFAVLGSLAVLVLAKPMTESLGGTLHTGYALTFSLFGLAAFLMLLICFACTRERSVPGARAIRKIGVRKQIAAIRRNRPFLLLVLFFTLFQVAFSLFRTVEIYYFKYVLGRGNLFPAAMLGAHLCAIVGMSWMPSLVKRLEKKSTALAGCGVGASLIGLTFLASQSPFLAIVGICLSYLFLAVPFALFFGMVPDTVEYGQWRTGIRSAGLVFSLLTFMQKFSMGVAVALASWVLDAAGYVPGQAQTPSAVLGIACLRTILPMCLLLVGMIPFLFYELDRKQMVAIVRKIEDETA